MYMKRHFDHKNEKSEVQKSEMCLIIMKIMSQSKNKGPKLDSYFMKYTA